MLSELLMSLETTSASFLTFMQKEVLYSSILFIVVLTLTRLLRKRSIYLHYGLWTLIFIRLILPPDWSLNFSARSLMDRIQPWQSEDIGVAPIVEQFAEPEASLGSAELSGEQPSAESGLTTFATASSSWWRLPSWRVGLFLSWAIGALVFAFVFSKRYFYYFRIVRRSKKIVDPTLLKTAAIWTNRYQIKRPVRFVTSEVCLSPFTIGVFRPIVYLPEVLLSGSKSDSLEAVVAHELAHVKQLDDLWIKLQNIVQLVYFFHPLVWLANSQLNQSRERICDALVLSYGTISPRAYGQSMLSILKMNLLGAEGVEMLPSFGNHKKRFMARIVEITGKSKIGKANRVASYALITALAIFLLPMARKSSVMSAADGEQIIILERASDSGHEFEFHTYGAGSHFQRIGHSQVKEMLCESKLPRHLKKMEFAALGLYDTAYRKIWLLKGENQTGGMEFYLDTDGDDCFTDEQALKVKRKTAKYHYEGDSEWVLAKYLKSQVMLGYEYYSDHKTKRSEFPIYLVYDSKHNFLQFENNDLWVGRAKLGTQEYPVALYGGLKSGWYLRPTFDETPTAGTKNQLRIDLNGNDFFEAMTVFDPARNEVIQEHYLTSEPILLNGTAYEVRRIRQRGKHVELTIAPKTHVTKVGDPASSKS